MSNDQVVTGKQAAIAVARTDLPRCARDVLTWRRTGKLPDDALLHQVAAAWAGIGDDDLQQAEGLVVALALESAAVANAKAITGAQFDVIAKMKGAHDPTHSNATTAARLVLVDGEKAAQVCKHYQLSPQALSNAVRRYRDAHGAIIAAYCGVGNEPAC
jgi:hypothetical protein